MQTTTAQIGAAVLATLLAMVAEAATLNVPGQYPTIQAAIDAAQPGDTVLVAAGTYNEAIDFLGKAITVRSSAGPGATTIDASGLDTSVVRFVSEEGPDSVVEGFTLAGGAGSVFQYVSGRCGGGVFAYYGSSPTILDCVFSGNSVSGHGSALFVSSGTANLASCNFHDNSGYCQVCAYGSAVAVSGSTFDGPGIAIHRWAASY